MDRRLSGVPGITRDDWYSLLRSELDRTLGDSGTKNPDRMHEIVQALLFLSGDNRETNQSSAPGLSPMVELLLFLSRDREELS